MIGTSTTYDLVFIIHIVAALDTLIVFLVMRSAGQAIARGADQSVQRKRFPNRRNWAARVIHVLPITGLIMSLSGDNSVALSKPWVGVGILCYLGMAGRLEARTLPQERSLAATIESDGVASPASGRAFVKSLDIVLAVFGVALLSMIIQF